MSLTPRPSILSIAPYVGGKSSAAGKKVVKLSSNESPLGPSPFAVEAYRMAAEKLHRYPDGQANALREAVAETHGLDVERIVCGAGSDELIGLLMQAYGGDGAEMLYSAHGFLMYKIYALANGVVPVAVPEKDLKTDVDALLSAVTERTRMVFVANPNNPTGSYISSGEMQRLRDGLPSDVLLVIDDAYAEYVLAPDYSDGRALVDAGDNTVMLRTLSKLYALPALRIGWGYFPATVADVLNRTRGPFNLSAPAIAAGAAALRDRAHVRASIEHNTLWRGWLMQELARLGLKPYESEGNFILVGFPEHGAHTAGAANKFLLNEGIIVRDVVAYGLPHCLRITVGLEEENQAVIEALSRFLS